MQIYLRILSIFYAFGATLHLADVSNLRLNFSEMSNSWKFWIIYLLVFDTIAAIGLWKNTKWGKTTFLIVALSQLVAYIGFREFFGDQTVLIIFHVLTLIIFALLTTSLKLKKSKT